MLPNTYQVQRLQELITSMVQCCEDRKLYERGRFDLPYAEVRCIMFFRGERYLTAKSISERMDVAKSRVSKLIESLIKKGFLERSDDPSDARVKLICLTLSGKAKVKEVNLFHQKIHAKLLMQMGLDERSDLLANLERLRGAMEVVKKDLA